MGLWRLWPHRRRQWLPLRRACFWPPALGSGPGGESLPAAPLAAPWGDLFGVHPPRLRGTVHRAAVPLPRPRPAEAPGAAEAARQGRLPRRLPRNCEQADKPSEQATPAPPQPSACRLALTDAIAIAPSIPDIRGAGGCGGEDLVRLEAIVLPDKRQVSVKPAAILRCAMASAIADWIRTDIAPLARASAARSAISTISTRSNAAAATASSARSSPSTAVPTRSMFAPSSSPMAARSR